MIFKHKYKFNSHTLKYEKVKPNFKQFFLNKALPLFVTSAVLGFSLMFVFSLIYSSPKEKRLMSENKFLKENLEKLNLRISTNTETLNELAERDNYIYRATFDRDIIPASIRNAGVGGTNRYAHLEGYETSKLLTDIIKKVDIIENKIKIQKSSYSEIISGLKQRDKEISSIPIIQPIHINDLVHVGSHYGYRQHPIYKTMHLHSGIDLVAPTGTPIYAPGDGVVIKVELNNSRKGYGNSIVIDHEVDGLTTRYAHLSKIDVKKGQRVKRGEIIGKVGNTGMSTAPHLHYEILINNAHVNPLRFMVSPSAEQYNQMIVAAKKKGVSFD